MPKKSKKGEILAIAKKLFSERGYDATGMDEIASTVNVPKSLIYYHFKNKQELLTTIIEEFLSGYKHMLDDDSQTGIDKITKYMDYLRCNKDAARIIVMESLKQSGNQMEIFKVLDTLRNTEQEPGEQVHWVTEFFTSIMPTILLACYEDNWNQYYGTDAGALADNYHKAYKWTHGAYHERINKESK